MGQWFLAIAAAFYVLAAVFGLAYLAGTSERLPRTAMLTLAGAVLAHAVHDGARWVGAGLGPFAGLREAISSIALVAAVGSLVLGWTQPRMVTLVAFVGPVALVLLLASFGVDARPASPLSGALLGVHIASTILATAAFTVAFALAAAYLVQERQVRMKRLRGVFQRLPPLAVLDVATTRSVALGLAPLTVGIVTGVLAGLREALEHGAPIVSWRHILAVAVWVVFAVVMLLRVLAGWRGRRTAMGTLVGYATALVVIAGYALRGSGP